jgi:hypothetical protein
MTIWRFPLAITDQQELLIPLGAKILTVQARQGIPCLWAVVDPSAPRVLRFIKTVGTGHDLPLGDCAWSYYIGTYQIDDGRLVFHVFEGAQL